MDGRAQTHLAQLPAHLSNECAVCEVTMDDSESARQTNI